MKKGPKKAMHGTDARRAGSHVVAVSSARITAVEDVVWLGGGHRLVFANAGPAEITLRFEQAPAAGTRKVYRVAAGERETLVLKQVTRRTCIKYAVETGSRVHDPIVIIDPNAPTGIR